jgi:hypothetical protein
MGASNLYHRLVYVWDPTNLKVARPPLGKQVLDPMHIWYTPCSGIWQTVWLESAPANRISKIDLDANMNGYSKKSPLSDYIESRLTYVVNVTVHSSGNSSSTYDFTIHHPKDMATTVTVQGTTNQPFTVRLENPELWSPESPTLYNVTVKLGVDTVSTYMGFRTISQGVVNDVKRPLLNGKFVFQFSTLDQGYWPDGIYSPPSVEAMEWDLKLLKDTGFNMVRKHVRQAFFPVNFRPLTTPPDQNGTTAVLLRMRSNRSHGHARYAVHDPRILRFKERSRRTPAHQHYNS